MVSSMCIKWLKGLFASPPPIEYERAPKVLVTNAINDYPGTENDLSGCLFDQSRVIGKLPEFQKRVLSDSQVTRKAFIKSWDDAIEGAISGDTLVFHYSGHGTQVKDRDGDEVDGYDEALYLWDGVLIDDDLNKVLKKIKEGVTVYIIMDCCFSGTNTRSTRNIHKSFAIGKPRFVQTEDRLYTKMVGPIVDEGTGSDITWMVVSASEEYEYAMEVIINGQAAGALTTFWAATLDRTRTYKENFDAMREAMPREKLRQNPTFEGPDYLYNKTIFT